MTLRTILFTFALTTTAAHRAHADDAVDVSSFEYIDVVETSDGSIWKGVVVEQTPNVRYKIATADGSLHVIQAADVVKLTKQKNPQWAHASTTSTTTTTSSGPHDVNAKFDSGGGGLPAPYAENGFRIDPESTLVFPLGTLSDAKVDTSFGTGVRAGYEALFGNFGLTGGVQARATWWRLPSQGDSAWTLETMLYGRAALHIGRVAPYAGVALGLDTNYIWSSLLSMSNTSLGFGMDVQGGLAVDATKNLAIDLGFDYHPATDTLNSMSPVNQSSEYMALHVGASLHL